jgi:polysaccharide biosynthesis transport protein
MLSVPPLAQLQAMNDQTSTSGAVLLLKTLRKHWPIVVSATLLTLGVGFFVTKSSTRIFESSVLLEIEPRASKPLGEKSDDMLDMGSGNYWDTRDYYETQYKIIQSDRVLGAVVRELALTSDLQFLELGSSTSTPITTDYATDTLRRHVTVEPVRNSRLVYIRVDDPDPGRGKRVSDAIANAYIEQNFQTALNATSDAVVWLNGQLDHVKQDLEHNENALYDFKQRNDLPSISINEAANMLRIEMQELDTALTHTRTKREELVARNAEMSKVSPENPDDLPASELLASPYLQELRKQYQEAVRERGALLGEGKGESHPLVKRVDEQVSTTRAALLAEVRNIQGAVARDLAVVTRQEGGEASLFETTRRRAVDLNMKEIEYHRLDRTREQNEKLFAMLIERLKETDLARMMKVNNIRVVDYASEAKVPIRPRLAVNLSVSLLCGLLFGILFAWVRDQLDSSLKTPDDLEQHLGVTFLGLLPEVADDQSRSARGARKRSKRAPGERPPTNLPSELIVHTHPLSGVAEAARSIRTNVMFMNPDKPHRKILVTSAAPAEGKTTVACSIAIALAQGGQRVCIVDCDMRRPRIHRVFDRAGDAGVTSVLLGEATLDEVAKPTMVNNLWAVPAGPIPPNPADMLHSDRFRRFIQELADRFERVVIDSPPLVAVTDSAIISTLCDGTIFVVRAFKTSKHLGAQGLRSLRDVESPVIGAVLNAVNLDRHEYNYYHYYYYKREGYTPKPGSDDQASAAPPN